METNYTKYPMAASHVARDYNLLQIKLFQHIEVSMYSIEYVNYLTSSTLSHAVPQAGFWPRAYINKSNGTSKAAG